MALILNYGVLEFGGDSETAAKKKAAKKTKGKK